MCGIAGFSGRFESSVLWDMVKSIRARGPDNLSVWSDDPNGVGLAHARLSIIDLSEAANQPMLSECGAVALVFNGEIYNYKSLRKRLESSGIRFRTNGDTEVLLNLYLRDGMSFLSSLNGIFAFAIFDSRTRSLFIARDGQGVKPLYYSELSKGVIFSSEIKALLQELSVSRELSAEAIASYLTYLWSPGSATMLKHVFKLDPGFCMEISQGRIIRKWMFYDLPYDQRIVEYSLDEAIATTTKLVKDAVETQLVSDVPLGAFLSGGLDSSAVVAMARQVAPGLDIPCFTIDFDDDRLRQEGMTEDLPYAEKVASHLGVKLHKVKVGSGMINDLEKMIFYLDEPQADPAPLNALYICQMARSQGIKVLLSGTGGDDIFTGYRRHYALGKERYWDWMPLSLRHGLKKSGSLLPKSNPLFRRISKALQYADIDHPERLASYFYWIDPVQSFGLFSRDFKEQLRGYSPAAPLLKTLARIPSDTHLLNKMLYLEGKHFLVDHNLNYTDKMSMASGVEVRVPLLDANLIAHAARLPVNLKQHGSVGKWIFKKAMEPYLPADVIYRPKTGFGAPLRYWMKNDLRPILDEVLSEKSIRNRGIFEPQAVNRMRKMDLLGKEDFSYPIFSLVCIELWCRLFIDKPVPSL